ncbi:MAG: DUF4910 domain-containing protein [Solirubrobacterales bacterium]|nr:DUF4910 domain-containing protein [Solirubrobacterales bacterium]
MAERLSAAADGVALHELVVELFPLARSIAGPDFRRTLAVLEREAGPMLRHAFSTGEQVFDWTVPPEWELRRAWIRGPGGETVVDSRDTNLHVVSHSRPVHAHLSLDELQGHLHSLPAQPDAVPYRTSYYEDAWGFCLADRVRRGLLDGTYEVMVDAALGPGRVEVGEIVVPGTTDREVLFSTYCCHPSMANNELSGPVVVVRLARELAQRPRPPRLTYRFVFVPETIGAIAYLSRVGERLRERLVAGYVITCVGTPFPFRYRSSRRGASLADRVAEHALVHLGAPWERLDFYPPRSDERQYCSPGFDLPVGCLSRVDFDRWPEYHTSLDDLAHVTPEALGESLRACRRLIDALEVNERFAVTVAHGEPQLGRRGLYPTLGGGMHAARQRDQLRDQMFLLNFCDGRPDLLAAAERCARPVWELAPAVASLRHHGLLRRVDAER